MNKVTKNSKELALASAASVDKLKLARRTFMLEFKADVVRHRKAENLSWADAGKAFDVLPKLVKEWESLYDKGLLTGEAGRRTVSPERAQIGALRSELSRLKMENAILKNGPHGRPRPLWEETSGAATPTLVRPGRTLVGSATLLVRSGYARLLFGGLTPR